MEDIIKEKYIEGSVDPLYYQSLERILFQMKNCICKINIKEIKSTGFFCKIPFPDLAHSFSVLATTMHSFNDLENQNSILISLNDDKEIKELKIDNTRKVFKDEKLDTAFIEILPDDKINNFLEVDDNLFKNEQNLGLILHKKSAYVLHYIEGDKMAMNPGIIRDTFEHDIRHSCSTSKGSAGAPILLLDSLKVIGIHKGCKMNVKVNLGTLINYPINEFIKNK